ncbi:MAG: thiol-disulfide oxidoreductase DCC family protein [Hyphomicrobiaceae bacterium]
MSDARPCNDTESLTVYFDGACPLCRREINVYRRMRGSDSIEWVDLSNQSGEQVSPDLSKQSALRRFHVRGHDGTLFSGAAAFAQLWMAVPSLSWLGRLVALPGIRHAAEVSYRAFLIVRPLLQKMTPR